MVDSHIMSNNKLNDPLLWWKSNGHRFPHLASLAKKYLSIPASSASAERLFSTSRKIVTELRSSLKSSTISDLTFMYSNKKNFL